MVVTEGRKSVVYHPARMRSRRDTRMILIRIIIRVKSYKLQVTSLLVLSRKMTFLQLGFDFFEKNIYSLCFTRFGLVAQLVEQRPLKAMVAGSNPARSTIKHTLSNFFSGNTERPSGS